MSRFSASPFGLLCFGAACLVPSSSPAMAQPPESRPGGRLRLGVAGLVHGHVYGFLYSAISRADVELVGIADPVAGLLRREKERHKLPDSVLFSDLETMLDKARPEAVAVFTDTFDHLEVVKACARRGIDVMMEKPMAVSMEHGLAIKRAAEQGGIHVLVNYETTWYPNTCAALKVVREQNRIGSIRRIVALTGHQGPKELGMPSEFLSWLMDPVRNGGGALYDFGCYGADLATCLMGERRPLSVTAVTQQLKADPAYQKVDDEAVIILTYLGTQVVIQASWNWPYNRKDMEIYGDRGYFVTQDRGGYRLRTGDQPEENVSAEKPSTPLDDPISYLASVVRGELEPAGSSSLKVNLIVTEILDAARRSARMGETVFLDSDEKTPEAKH